MSKILLYLDEDAMDDDLVQALRFRGVDVLTATEAGMLHRNDDEQLYWATVNRRVLYSFNVKDFYQLHTRLLEQASVHAGIILAPQQRYSVGEQMRGIIKLISTKSAEDIQSQVEFLSNWIESI